jgi:hypothetical protein
MISANQSSQPYVPPSATQPGPTSALSAGIVKINPAGMRALGAQLYGRFRQYESDRRLAELKWERNARQYLGVYDPDIERQLDQNRSRAYPKLTRWKCVSMLSRLMNLLFQADDKNWTVTPSAVPDLDQEDLQTVLDQIMATQQASDPSQAAAMPGGPPQKPDDAVIEQAIREFAKKRARRMELEIEDQLQELGGNRACDYVSLCRKVIASGIQYGAGILKGPFVREEQMRRWDMDAQGRLIATPYNAYRPCYEWVSLWDYYPDMSAKTLAQMDGQFERVVMSRHQVVMLKQRPDFMADQIDIFLRQWPQGNYVRRAFETELRAMGVAINVSQSEKNKYEAWVWDGYVHGTDLAACGVKVPDDKLEEDLKAIVWLMGDYVVKAEINPWSQLETDREMNTYHHFIFEEDETFLLGNGLPAIVRDSQLGLCAATRMALDNGGIQRVFEFNTQLLSPNQDITSINPDKIFYRDDDNPATAQYPAIRAIDMPVHLEELTGLVHLFQGFADSETFVNAATGGDMQKGPSEPFRTATGASMLRGDAALPFKDVVRNVDMFTESLIGSMLVFNRNFSTNPAIKGDFKPVARGATSLIAKEVLGIQLDNFAQTLTDEEKQYVNMRNLARARVRVRDLDVEDIVYDDARCDAIDAAASQQQQQQQQSAQQMLQAQIREILAGALKDLSQAGKNSAAAEATTANVILSALEKGLNPDQVSPTDLMGGNDGGNGTAAAGQSAAASGAGAGDGGAAGGSGPAAAGAGMPGGTGPVVAPGALAAAAQQAGPQAAAMPAF